ncbi:MAG: SsrA-binding protein SmpB [Bacteroidales bacterium]|jgi:SsrA-binding protein|nr:SsrA-binding protein SmpB [Bacteroidales bacterium]
MANTSEIKNRKATHEYFLEEKLTAGIVLSGSEIKSIREGKASLKEAYCYIRNSELFIKSMHIAEYKYGSIENQEPRRDRKLLVTKNELKKLSSKVKEKGNAIIPVRLFINEKGLAKMEIALAKGKKLHDKRDSLKEKDMKRQMKDIL